MSKSGWCSGCSSLSAVYQGLVLGVLCGRQPRQPQPHVVPGHRAASSGLCRVCSVLHSAGQLLLLCLCQCSGLCVCMQPWGL